MPWARVAPVVDNTVRALCVRPYPGHPNGCPNFDKKVGCPPGAQHIDDIIHVGKYEEVWAIWNRFDFGFHVQRMRRDSQR